MNSISRRRFMQFMSMGGLALIAREAYPSIDNLMDDGGMDAAETVSLIKSRLMAVYPGTFNVGDKDVQIHEIKLKIKEGTQSLHLCDNTFSIINYTEGSQSYFDIGCDGKVDFAVLNVDFLRKNDYFQFLDKVYTAVRDSTYAMQNMIRPNAKLQSQFEKEVSAAYESLLQSDAAAADTAKHQ